MMKKIANNMEDHMYIYPFRLVCYFMRQILLSKNEASCPIKSNMVKGGGKSINLSSQKFDDVQFK